MKKSLRLRGFFLHIRIVVCLATLLSVSEPTISYGQGFLTNDDVIKMVKAGLSPQIIITSIKGQKCSFNLAPDEIIRLKNSNVSEEIITAMLSSGAGSAEVNGKKATSEIKIPDGTEVKLSLLKPLSSSNAHVEDRVELEAVQDLVIEGTVVVKKGAHGYGRITEAKSHKSFGRSGKLNFTIDTVKSVDDQNIRLRATREARGNESYGKAGVVTILVGPFGALVKGKEVGIAAGTEYTIYIDGDRTIKLKSGS